MHCDSKDIFENRIRQRIIENIRIKEALLEQVGLLADIAKIFIETYRNGGKIFFFGNGGSAADAQHLAAEFVGRYYHERRPFPAIALNVNTSCITAIGNDYGFEKIFARQIEALGNAGDIAVGISTSGNSHNIIEGIRAAKEKKMFTVGFTGADGGMLKKGVSYCICIPSNDTPRIQEGHIMVGHILCEIIERELLGVD